MDQIRVRENGGSAHGGEAPAKECPECHALIAAGYSACPDCGYEFPAPERANHDAEASTEGVLSGQVIHELVSLIDIPPTLLAGGTGHPPVTMRGRPLQGLLSDKVVDWPQEVFLQISESQVGRAIRTERWKYAVSAPGKKGWLDPESDLYVEEHLYDLAQDPLGYHDVAGEPESAVDLAQARHELLRRLLERERPLPRTWPY